MLTSNPWLTTLNNTTVTFQPTIRVYVNKCTYCIMESNKANAGTCMYLHV